jgi:hypothetical protein
MSEFEVTPRIALPSVPRALEEAHERLEPCTGIFDDGPGLVGMRQRYRGHACAGDRRASRLADMVPRLGLAIPPGTRLFEGKVAAGGGNQIYVPSPDSSWRIR